MNRPSWLYSVNYQILNLPCQAQ